MTRALAPLTALALLFACTTEAGDEQGNDSNGGSESASEGDTDGACSLPTNETPEGSTTISVQNARDVPIYVQPYSSFVCNYGQVEILAGGEPVLWDHSGTYPYDCSANLCDYGCSDGGAMGWIINPGEIAQVQWNGGVWQREPLPEACAQAADCLNTPGPTCDARSIFAGEYTVRVHLGECPVEDECPECTEGVCEVFFYEPGVGLETFEASAEYPSGVAVVVD